AAAIDVVSYRWTAARWSSTPAFHGGIVGHLGRTVPQSEGLHDEPAGRQVEPDATAVDEPWPSIDWDIVARPAVRPHSGLTGGSPDADSSEDVDSYLYCLAGGRAVLLEADESSKCLVIDLEEEGDSRLKRLRPQEIEPGMFVVLRAHGGGDYVVPVADF